MYNLLYQKCPILLISLDLQRLRLQRGVNGIRTWIVGVDGKHADHLTTTTAQACGKMLPQFFRFRNSFRSLIHIFQILQNAQRPGKSDKILFEFFVPLIVGMGIRILHKRRAVLPSSQPA